MLTFEEIKKNEALKIYIKKADESLSAMGFTEHSFAHMTKVAKTSRYILRTLGYPERDVELVGVAAYIHDIGNIVNRADHAQSGAVMAFRILDHMGADPEDIATVICAIGNHDESTAVAVNPIAAALILADKSDVRRSRVRNREFAKFDIHDRVNYAVVNSETRITDDKKVFELNVTIDTSHCAVMDYFEIFLNRMILCRKASEKLGLVFRLIVNGQQIV